MKKLLLTMLTLLCISSYATELTKDQIKAIAKQYATALEEENYEAWKTLLDDSCNLLKSDFEKDDILKSCSKVTVNKIVDYNFAVHFKYSNGVESIGWIQLLSNGKIKYETIANEHPIFTAFYVQDWINNTLCPKVTFDEATQKYIDDLIPALHDLLRDTGIPLHGLDETDDKKNS